MPLGQYRIEISLSSTANRTHLQLLLDAAAEMVPAPLSSTWPKTSGFRQVRPGSWELVCVPTSWATFGTPLLFGLLVLERSAGHDIWQVLGPEALGAAFRVAAAGADGRWIPVYQAG